MSFLRAFEVSLILLILSGGTALGLAEGSPVPVLLLAMASLHQSIRGWRPAFGRPGLNAVAFLVLLYGFLDIALISSWDLLVTLGHVVVAMQIVTIYHGWRSGGVWRILLLGLMQVVVAASVMVHSAFLIPFAAFVFFAVCVLSLYRLDQDSVRVTPIQVRAGFLLRVAAPALLVLGTTGIIFFSFPRLGAGWFGHARGSRLSMIGFGDRINMDEIGRLLDNPEEVMTVVTGESFEVARLWRGKVFDTYDGKTWVPHKSPYRAAAVRTPGNRKEFRMDWGSHRGGRVGGAEITQEITLNPVEPRVIFACLDPVRVFFPHVPPPGLGVDAAWAITTSKPRGQMISYEVTSRLPLTSKAAGATEEEIAEGDHRWLGLDETRVNVPRLRDLAERVISEAAAKTPYEKAKAIESYLRDRGGFGYTLDVPRMHPDAREAVESFLFYRKQGHCQYYASSMVLLLRTQGIQCRLVNGFKGGEWHPLGGYYLVRQRHAHAWTEVYFGKKVGWIPMDPTPGSSDLSLAYAFQSLENLIQYLKYQWVTRVITYNSEDQAGVLRWATVAIPRLLARARVPLVAAGLLALLLAARRLATGRLRRRKGRPRAGVVRVSFYRDLVRLLARMGHRRSPGETPLEFARRIGGEPGEALSAVEPITDAYYRVRFGGASLSPDETATVTTLLTKVTHN